MAKASRSKRPDGQTTPLKVTIGVMAVMIVLLIGVVSMQRCQSPPVVITTSTVSTTISTTMSTTTETTTTAPMALNHYLDLAVGQWGQVGLPVNPTTGTSWWVQSSSNGLDIVASTGTDASHTCAPMMAGCSNQLAIYSFRANATGSYTAELRLGHSWASSEYYEVDTVYITVQNSTSAP